MMFAECALGERVVGGCGEGECVFGGESKNSRRRWGSCSRWPVRRLIVGREQEKSRSFTGKTSHLHVAC